MSNWFLPLLILSIIVCCIEVEVSVPGFPDIAKNFHTTESLIELTVGLNFLGFCLSALFYGPLSHNFGRRPIMVFGNGLLLLGAIGCFLAPSINFLLAARFIQGLGASTSAVLVFTMIADVYQGSQATKLIGRMNAILTIIMALAPLIGSFINNLIGWRGNYGFIALLSFSSWFSLYLYLPETQKKESFIKLKDVLTPYKKLLLSHKFLALSLVPSFFYASYMAFITQSSFLYREAFGLSLLQYTLHQGLIIGTFSLVSFFSDKILKALEPKRTVSLGLFLCVSTAFLMFLLSLFNLSTPLAMTLSMSFFSAGFAACYPVIFTESFTVFSELKGFASSLTMSLRAFLCFFLVAVTGYFYKGTSFAVATVILSAMILSSFLLMPFFKAFEKFAKE